jgi:transglutaminase-like putative cysteine protease
VTRRIAVRFGLVAALLAASQTASLAQAPAPAAQAAKADTEAPKIKELWYAVLIGGKKSGWSRSTVTTTNDEIRSAQEMTFTIKRENAEVTLSTTTEFIEAIDGTPKSMRAVQSMGSDPTETLFEFTADGVKLTTITKNSRQTTVLPTPKDEWLTPSQVEAFILKSIKEGKKEFSYATISPTSGTTIVTESRKQIAFGEGKFGDKTIKTYSYEVKNSAAPTIPIRETIDEFGDLVNQRMETGAFTIVTTKTTKEKALADIAAPEIMVSTYIVPDKPLPRSSQLTKATYILRVPDGEAPVVATTSAQSATPEGERGVRVVIDIESKDHADVSPEQRTAALAATTIADANDAEIIRLVERATKDVGPDPAKRAEAMRRFVHIYIKKKDLTVGFASASETARSAAGDCSEHGVLLAAMLRADKIPARAVSGLVHVPGLAKGKGAFGYHLWTQALLTIDGHERWLDLDATLSQSTRFDATHIALVVSDLADNDTMTSMVSIVPLLGRLSIDVVETTPPLSNTPREKPNAK